MLLQDASNWLARCVGYFPEKQVDIPFSSKNKKAPKGAFRFVLWKLLTKA
jgi:hypothetical protein